MKTGKKRLTGTLLALCAALLVLCIVLAIGWSKAAKTNAAALPEVRNNGTAIHALFTEKDLPDYMTYTSSECPMCKSGQKVDALVNSFGYSKI